MAKRIFKAEGYQGPITFTFEEMTSEFIKQNEEAVLKAVMRCNVQVDKEELLKALKYDRGQFDKGYNAGFVEGCSAVEDLLFFCDEDFLKGEFKEYSEGFTIEDLIAKYGAFYIIKQWNKWKALKQSS